MWLVTPLPPSNQKWSHKYGRTSRRDKNMGSPTAFPRLPTFSILLRTTLLSSPPPQPDKISWSNLWFCAEFQIQTKRMQYRTDIIRRLCCLSFLLLRVILFSFRRLGKLYFLFRTWRNSLKRTSHPCLSAPPWCCNIWFPVVVEVMDVKKT